MLSTGHPRSSGCLIFWGFPERFCVYEEGNMPAWVKRVPVCAGKIYYAYALQKKLHTHVTSAHVMCVCWWALSVCVCVLRVCRCCTVSACQAPSLLGKAVGESLGGIERT